MPCLSNVDLLGISRILVFLILLIFQSVIARGFDYCSISRSHTMCMFKTISKNCVQYKTQGEKTVQRMVDDHNTARSKFAGGSMGYFVPNMMKVYWDQELADISARWACQCKGVLDYDRAVSRFEVGQVVWTVMHPTDFTKWIDIWNYIISGGTGFFRRDYWNNMITNYDPSDPLSLIYNPGVRYIGCTLAKYLLWSVEVSKFAYTTTLVCNYAPVEDSYPRKAREDWPCQACPKDFPCFIDFYLRANVAMPTHLPNQRNLCIDPRLEYEIPLPGKPCRPAQVVESLRAMPNHNLTFPKMNNGPHNDTALMDWIHNPPPNSTSVNQLPGPLMDDDDDDDDDGGDEEDVYEDESEEDEQEGEEPELIVEPQDQGKDILNFCKLNCGDGEGLHTLCLYKNSTSCESFLSHSNAMVEEDLLHLHNQFRDQYTEGQTKPLHPSASNIIVMEWNTILGDIALKWLQQCKVGHDKCRDTPLPDVYDQNKTMHYQVSQNIAWKYFESNESTPSHRDLFNSWTKQAERLKSAELTDYIKYNDSVFKNATDFVQLVWANTRFVGCSFGSWLSRIINKHVALLVCNYAPAGRIVGRSVYIPGGPCSNCLLMTDLREGHCQRVYPNLCNGIVRSKLPTSTIVFSSLLLAVCTAQNQAPSFFL